MKYPLIIFSLFILSSCAYNKEELPVPETTTSVNGGVPNGPVITYTQHTKKYFDNYCTACHAPGLSQGFFPLTNFTEVSVYTGTNGKIETRVLVQGNMPPSGSASGFLTPTEKDTLQMWLDQGAPQ
jgi:mono/diheme cytochrome c family protein